MIILVILATIVLSSTAMCAQDSAVQHDDFLTHAVAAKWHLQSGYGLQYQHWFSDNMFITVGGFTLGPGSTQGPNVSFNNLDGYSSYHSHTFSAGMCYAPIVELKGLFVRFDVNYDIKEVHLYQLSGTIVSNNQGSVDVSHGKVEQSMGGIILVPGITYNFEITDHLGLQLDVGYNFIISPDLDATLEYSRGNDQLRYTTDITVENVYQYFNHYDLPQISAGIVYRF